MGNFPKPIFECREKKNNIWVEQILIYLVLKRKVKTLSALTRLLNKDEGTFLHVDFSNYYNILHTYTTPFSRVPQTSSWFTKKVILTVYLWWKKKFIIGNKKDAAGSRHNSHPKYNFMMIIFQMCIWFHGCFNKRLACQMWTSYEFSIPLFVQWLKSYEEILDSFENPPFYNFR